MATTDFAGWAYDQATLPEETRPEPGETATEGKIVLKHDRLFLLVDGRGDIAPGHALGLFHDDTRILSRYGLRFEGGPPALLSSQVPDEMYRAQIDFAISDRAFGGLAWDPTNVIHIRRELFLEDRLVERVTLTNYLTEPLDYRIELELGCDFADIFEVRGWHRERRGTLFEPVIDERFIEFRYEGLDGTLIRSGIYFHEPPDALGPGHVGWQLLLEPGARQVLEWEVLPEGVAPAPPSGGGENLLERRRATLARAYNEWQAGCARWRTEVEDFDSTLAQSVSDLRALYTDIDNETVITAGIPWYSTVFGRDSIITSLETLPLNPRIAVDTLRYLARHQGEREDPFTEEQPGRIMHELRRGEMARAGEIPHIPYYGTIDATPLWLVLLHETWRWTGDAELVRELLPTARRALAWIDRYGDLDGDGFIEYARSSEKGLINQGWKDSGDGVPFPDGVLPEPPIALVEVQGYAYDAKLRTAVLLDAIGEPEEAARLRLEAAGLRERILDRFWLPELGTFALALDGDKRPIPTVTTNAGHLLWSRVPTPEQAASVAARMLAPDMFSGWGIRTLSAAHPVYNPMSYHNGSIWPHDNALVVLGLAHYGHGRAALPVIEALHDAAVHMEFFRLPELFCGMQRAHGMRPVLYPVSCSPQAWASGAMFMLLQAALGIMPDGPAGVLHIREPHLPRFLRHLSIEGLHVGGSRVALEFRRRGDRTLANLLGVEGAPLHVRIELT